MATYTANYGLHQWVPGDNFLRTDFNTDFQKIDAGIKAALSTAQGKAEIVTGFFTGDGTASRAITLGFQPKAVLIESQDGQRPGDRVTGGLSLPAAPLTKTGSPALTITATGFTVVYNIGIESLLNRPSMGFRYLAVK